MGWVLSGVLLAVIVLLLVWQLRGHRIATQEGLDTRRQAQDEASSIRADAQDALERARGRAREIMAESDRYRQDAEGSIAAQRSELREIRAEQERRESRLRAREDRLAIDAEDLLARQQRLDGQRARLQEVHDGLEREREQVTAELERVAGLTQEAARAEILAAAEHHTRLQATTLARTIEDEARRDATRIAQSVIATAIQRCAAEQTAESVVVSVHLPSDDLKGRIIGREGRNIRAFEQVTGVNLLIDDTPETVLLSSFDPVRRETARVTLEHLIADGRIHPGRIEEVQARSERTMAERILHNAEEALADVGITDLDPELMPYLGALAYRTSYGQNVLKHLVESAHLAGVIAAELGIDVVTCKRAAFLHDIGKSLTHEHEGPHAAVGADLLRRHGEDADIVHAVEAHHNEVEPTTVEAIVVQAADAISGSRPGARRESVQAYVQRMEDIESLARSHTGVERVYAMQAGRDVRIMVAPEEVDDPAAQALARDIAKQVESEMSYPGQIKITVIRESRATATAE